MEKLYIYAGITIGGLVGAYFPVLLFHSNPLGVLSIVLGSVGSLIGLYIGYRIYQNSE